MASASNPALIGFRLLDGELHGLTDMSVPADQFACLSLSARRVFITDNEINFLAFPRVRDSLVIFGAGYSFEPLAQANWLQQSEIVYWDDLDTHSLAILDQLRSNNPQARS